MNKIALLVPYFGKLPSTTKLWLLSCSMNPGVDFLIFTDDETPYDYPDNVKVTYCTYETIKHRIQANFDFGVTISRPWKLCDFRPAYGEIFKNELLGYQFWGHCDMDQVWGDVCNFVTEDILERYERIGYQGHFTLYKNTPEVNARYKTHIPGRPSFVEVFQSPNGFCFDEEGQSAIYDYLGLPYFQKPVFAHLDAFHSSFFLGHQSKDEDYKNKRQVIVWKNGKIYRVYAHQKKLYWEEFMYFHMFMRPVKICIDAYDLQEVYVCYPDKFVRVDAECLTYRFVYHKGKCSKLVFYFRMALKNKHKLKLKNIIKYFTNKRKKQCQTKK